MVTKVQDGQVPVSDKVQTCAQHRPWCRVVPHLGDIALFTCCMVIPSFVTFAP